MTWVIFYFVVSALIGLVAINWSIVEPDCNCDLCQSPDAIATRQRIRFILSKLSWQRQALFALIWSVVALPVACLVVSIVIIELLLDQ